jgi:hypothetical protein
MGGDRVAGGPAAAGRRVAGALAARRDGVVARGRVVVRLVALALVVALGSALGPHSRDAASTRRDPRRAR